LNALADFALGLGRRRSQRQKDAERGSFSHLAFHFNETAMGFDDSVTDRKPQPGSLAHGLGGEKRIEYAPQVLLRNAAAGVDDRYFYMDSAACAAAWGCVVRRVLTVMLPFSSMACWALTSMFIITCLI